MFAIEIAKFHFRLLTDFPCLKDTALLIISAVSQKAINGNSIGLVDRGTPSDGNMRTLIYHDGALGDVLLSLACLKALGEGRDELHFVGRPDTGGLLEATAVVDGSTSSDSGMFAGLFASGANEQARAFLGRFDRAFVFTLTRGGALERNIAAVVPATRSITTVPPEGVRTHVTDFRLSQANGRPWTPALGSLLIPQAATEAALRKLALAGHDGKPNLIAVHPGSGGKGKCWPLERYLEAAARLSAGAGSFVLFLSGPAEGPERTGQIARFAAGRERVAHIADVDLMMVAGLLSRCDLSLGNDSGISHLAAAVGCPVIALFGPTDPALWGPRGAAVQVVAADALTSLTVDQVVEAAEEAFSRHR